MTDSRPMIPSSTMRLPGLKALAIAAGLTVLTAAGALAAQHGAKPQQGQSQQMQQQMQGGPSFERMQEMMQQARETTDPAERRQLTRQHMQMMVETLEVDGSPLARRGPARGQELRPLRQHMQMMVEKMQAMHGMMGNMPMQGQMGGRMSGDQGSGSQGMGMSGDMSGDMSERMQQMMGRMQEQQGMMQQMMQQMLEQQRMMMEMDEDR